ncbi:RNase J family beta-CASP ribonuclease [Candidatus Woesearchaeota archaeon]|nr:RNase J family beta-CASP ribonuclease [Candidatus Woesearchaeota archaeon]
MIKVFALGGYKEFGRNMTAVQVDDEVVIIDMGIHLENYINLTEDEDLIQISKKDLENADAIPHMGKIKDIQDKVVGIIPTHAHLDHIGAIPFLAKEFSCPIYCTNFTGEVVRTLFADERRKLKNPIVVKDTNSKFNIGNIKVEFINVAHSTPQTIMVAIHTEKGAILYCNDFKLDSNTVLGERPNIERIKELKGKVLALICDSTYSIDDGKTESELVAKDMLENLLLKENYDGKVLIITTFSSHLARLNSIVEFAKKINRKVIFLGRSLHKYISAGQNAGIIDFSKYDFYKYRREIDTKLKKIMTEGPQKYLLVVTGHQGEPKATLSRIARGLTPLNLLRGDVVIFSSSVIPVKTNIENREELEKSLSQNEVKMFRDVHVSGHASKEDIEALIDMIRPENIIPAHGDVEMLEGVRDIAKSLNINESKIHILSNGDSVDL